MMKFGWPALAGAGHLLVAAGSYPHFMLANPGNFRVFGQKGPSCIVFYWFHTDGFLAQLIYQHF
jgi:hypothetical protein